MIYLKDKHIWIYLVFLFIGFIVSILFFDFNRFLMFAIGICLGISLRMSSLKEISDLENKNKELNDAKEELENFRSMGLLRVLKNKDDTSDYSKRIENLKSKLYVMGSTAKKLIDDFANIHRENNPEKKVLLEALARGVKVKILIAQKRYLKERKKPDYEPAKKDMKILVERYPNFEIKYFKHIPTHSIFLFDDECFIGPVFEELDSHDTPVLHMKCDSNFVQKYLDHFDMEWNNAEELAGD